MATNRYGQIWHGDYHHINIRFPSTEARLKFQNEFEAYHQGHDHEGDIPTFKCVSSKDLKLSTGSRSPQDLVKAETDEDYRITIDGYSWNEIHEYHNPTGWKDSFWYSVPTCCVPPIIVVDHKFVDSGTLQRHELSAIFGDMPEQDYKSLLESVQRDGFIDDTIKLLDGQILDGWHRYRAAQELNLIRKLRSQQWNEDEGEDGDPKAFVLARNIERRHLSASQRAQIAVAFNERFGHGGDRKSDEIKGSNGPLKTTEDLAKQANVGISTIKRAVTVEKTGQSETVIAGEKTAGEVLEEQKAKALAETEAASAVVKPRFQDAVETWRSSQVERLRKFEVLPVGRTPLIESEYLKSYFELAQPRIQQNTKPTAAHYEGAIECMLDLPVAFAEQLQGRHYRRIIKEWDQSVLLQLVERFQSGHILGYPALQTDSDANAVRIRQAIRDHHGFKGRITSQPFEVLFEITEDAHTILVQLNPKEWIREGREISWAVSLLPEVVNANEKVEQLKQQRQLAMDAETKMWNAYRDSDLPRHIDKDTFVAAACERHSQWGVTEFPDPMETDIPAIWESRFNLLIREIGLPCVWIQEIIEPDGDVESEMKPEAEVTEAPAEDEPDMNALWNTFNKRYPKWKAKYAESGYKENDLIQASTETEMLDALRVYRESDRKGMPTADEVKDMTDLMSQQSYPFARCLRDLLRAKGISDWTAQHQQTLESVQKFKEKLKAFGASDDLVDDSLHFYNGIEESELSTSSQETLKQLNEFLQGFIDKPLPEWPEWIRNQVPEIGEELPGIDIQAMRSTLSSLLESLGIDDTHRGLQESLGGDLLDVFLQYEELPTAKEQLIALLNTADAILSEMIP